jgi:hypothetical protein
VHGAELGDGIVAVLEEDALVELLGALRSRRRRHHGRRALSELVEVEPAQRLG